MKTRYAILPGVVVAGAIVVLVAATAYQGSVQGERHAAAVAPSQPGDAAGAARAPFEVVGEPVDASAAVPPDIGSRTRRHVFSIPDAPVQLQFPDGELISVSFRRVPPVQALRDALAAPVASTLQDERGADAFARYLAADRCRAVVRRMAVNEDGGASCPGDGDHYAVERMRWLRTAAEAGHVHAVRQYANDNVDSTGAIDLFEAAWLAGYISPLGQLADRYLEQTGADDRENERRALAYLWLQAHLQAAAANEGRQLYVADLFAKLREREQRMAPSDVEAAMQLAKEMLRKNARCCFGP